MISSGPPPIPATAMPRGEEGKVLLGKTNKFDVTLMTILALAAMGVVLVVALLLAS